MLHILFVILKAAGILLAVLLGLLITALLCVLFVPIRYKGEAEAAGTPESVKADGRVSWLLHLVSVHVTYEGQTLDWRLRAGWKKFPGSEEREPEEPEQSEKPKQPEEPEPEPKPAGGEELPKEPEPVPAGQERHAPRYKEKKKSKRKKWKKPDVGRIFRRIEYTFHRICDRIKALFEKGKSLEEAKDRIQAFLEDEIHRYAFYRIKDELLYLLRKIRPSKVQAQIHFGAEDPYVTGQILAALAVIYPFLGEGVTVQPDFEASVLEGTLRIKGRMRVIHFIAPACRLFFDKQIKAAYRDIKAFKVRS